MKKNYNYIISMCFFTLLGFASGCINGQRVHLIDTKKDNEPIIKFPGVITRSMEACPYLLETYGGGGNGITDNTAALSFVLAAQTGPSKCLTLKVGDYYFASSPTISLSSGESLSVIGVGVDASIIDFASGSGLIVTYADQTVNTHWSNLTITTRGDGTATGITLTQLSTNVNPAGAALTTFDNIVLRGSDGYTKTNYWGSGIISNQVSNINFIGLAYYGQGADAWTSVGEGVVLNAGLYGSDDFVNFGVVYNFIACTFEYAGKGIIYGKDIQGVTVTGGSNFTGGTYGIYVNSGSALGTLDQLTVADSQFNSSGINIYDGGGVTNLMVHHNSFLLASSSAAGVQLNPCAGCIISDNTFESLFGQGTTNAIVIGSVPSGYSGIVSGNYCNTVATCVFLQSGSQYMLVYGNSAAPGSVGNVVVNSGTNNNIVF